MAAYSKLIKCTCYELGHTWTPSCLHATRDVILGAIIQSLQIYTSLYTVAGLLRGRDKNYFKSKIFREILQSTLFLTTNAFTFISSFCIWRHFMGEFTYLSVSFLPAVCASYLAILVERKSRRGLLALYMANLATELGFRMLEARGYVKAISNGEVMIFSLVTATFLYLFRSGSLDDSIASTIRLFLGKDEDSRPKIANHEQKDNQQVPTRVTPKKILDKILPGKLKLVLDKCLHGLRHCSNSHTLCKHKFSCLSYTIEGSLRMFGIGLGIQYSISLLGTLKNIFKNPLAVWHGVINKKNLKLGAFLGSFVGLFRAANCLLRRLRNKDEPIHGCIAGFIAGWSMLFYKSTTIALYLAFKLCEILYFKGIERGWLPYIRCADVIIYALSTALMFHAAVIEPHNIRPAYWRFLLKLTRNKFAEMNRKLLDPFGLQSSKLYPDYWPKYNPRYTDLARNVS